MWGIRASRVGFFLGGVLAMSVGAGCCECCKHLWKSEKAVPGSQPTAPARGDDKDAEKVLSDWKRNPDSAWQRTHGGMN
jgi:hypothetical protein